MESRHLALHGFCLDTNYGSVRQGNNVVFTPRLPMCNPENLDSSILALSRLLDSLDHSIVLALDVPFVQRDFFDAIIVADEGPERG